MMNKRIVVVGASRGIGAEIVKQMATSGYEVWALSRDLKKMQGQFSEFKNIHCHHIDLNTKNIRYQCEEIFNEIGNIDILINNAGYLVNKPFTDLTREDLEVCYNVNILGVIETTQSVIKYMPEGHIVNISSMGGFQGSVKFPGLTAYSTSKAAVCSFTELFSEEYKDSGIAMNCLCLGAAQTEMLEEAFPGYQAPVSAEKMAEFIVNFALTANQWIKGKIIPVSLSTP